MDLSVGAISENIIKINDKTFYGSLWSFTTRICKKEQGNETRNQSCNTEKYKQSQSGWHKGFFPSIDYNLGKLHPAKREIRRTGSV